MTVRRVVGGCKLELFCEGTDRAFGEKPEPIIDYAMAANLLLHARKTHMRSDPPCVDQAVREE